MKTNLTSLELHYLINELQFLIGSRIDNIYAPKNEEIILQLHSSGGGKQLLRIIPGKLLYLASEKQPAEEPSGFCMFLRKNLGNARLISIQQLKPERIVEFLFEKEDKKRLIVELFGKGNVVLCDKDEIVLSALIFHKWKDREIKAKIKYSYPKTEYNIFDLKLNDLKELCVKSRKSLVKCLATELGLGGKYSEEVCLLSNINKNAKPLELNNKDIEKIFNLVNKLINNKIKPLILYQDNEVKDIVPFELKIYKDLRKKEFNEYNKAFDYYLLEEFKEEKPKTKQEKEIEKLKRIIERQEEKIKELSVKEIEERKKGDLIYENYKLINEILAELKRAPEKYSWKEIEKKLEGHRLIKAVNPKDKTIEIEI